MTQKPGGKPGNRNAAKDDADKASSQLIVRCRQNEKANWVRSAQAEGLTLTAWVVKNLNNAASK